MAIFRVLHQKPGLLRFQKNRPSNARKLFNISLKRTQKNAKNAKFSKTVFFKRKSTKNQVFTGFLSAFGFDHFWRFY
jgi:hypothetical protein